MLHSRALNATAREPAVTEVLIVFTTFAKEEDGAQVIAYALIVAVVSIALVIALQGLTEGGYFTTFIERVGDCLTGDMAGCSPPAAP